jgi:hypothetical protein
MAKGIVEMGDFTSARCAVCSGSKVCPGCAGTGIVDHLYQAICAMCSGNGICFHCAQDWVAPLQTKIGNSE